jgi:hypothetical protein
MEDGPIRIMAGHGFRIGNGVGPRSIMAAGFSTPIVDGSGFLAGIGFPLGLHGITEMVGLVGLRFHRVLTGEQELTLMHMSGPNGGALWKKGFCLNKIFETTLFSQLVI